MYRLNLIHELTFPKTTSYYIELCSILCEWDCTCLHFPSDVLLIMFYVHFMTDTRYIVSWLLIIYIYESIPSNGSEAIFWTYRVCSVINMVPYAEFDGASHFAGALINSSIASAIFISYIYGPVKWAISDAAVSWKRPTFVLDYSFRLGYVECSYI